MNNNHFYLYHSHIQMPSIGTYPVYLTQASFDCLGQGDDCSFIEACVKFNRIEHSQQSLIECSKILHKQVIDILRKYVSENLAHYNLSGMSEMNCMNYLIETIPIYLVYAGQINKHASLTRKQEEAGPCVPPDTWNCVDIPIDTLVSILDKESLDIIGKCGGVLLGLYNGERNCTKQSKTEEEKFVFLTTNGFRNSIGVSRELIRENRRIFLWIDHIYDAAHEFKCSFEGLFLQVLCHEFMHAFMDVYTFDTLQVEGANGCEIKIYEEYREESLANGLSLYLLKQSEYNDQYEQIVEFVRNQPLQYKLGLAYQNQNQFEPALQDWMELKKGQKSINKTILYNWMRNATKTLDMF